jgi:hypothetical protein
MMMVAMVFNATFNNISVISWRSVLLVEEESEWKRMHVRNISKMESQKDNLRHLNVLNITLT